MNPDPLSTEQLPPDVLALALLRLRADGDDDAADALAARHGAEDDADEFGADERATVVKAIRRRKARWEAVAYREGYEAERRRLSEMTKAVVGH